MTHSPTSSSFRRRWGLPLAALLLVGCQQKMAVQPSLKPMAEWKYGEHGSSSRLPVEGTVARGYLRVDSALYRGRPEGAASTPSKGDAAKADGAKADPMAFEPSAQPTISAEARENNNVVAEFPFPITREVLEHGRDRYMIYCVVCHDPLGTGRGKIVERGYTRPPSYHIPRLRAAPVGHFFAVVTEGYGSMPSYSGQIPPRDRWAIVAYVRALQLSQHFPEKNLSDAMRRERDEAASAAPHSEAAP